VCACVTCVVSCVWRCVQYALFLCMGAFALGHVRCVYVCACVCVCVCASAQVCARACVAVV